MIPALLQCSGLEKGDIGLRGVLGPLLVPPRPAAAACEVALDAAASEALRSLASNEDDGTSSCSAEASVEIG